MEEDETEEQYLERTEKDNILSSAFQQYSENN